MAKDEADEASEQEEYYRQEGLYLARRALKRVARGSCLNCHSPVEGAFCDADCRDDYMRREQVCRSQNLRTRDEAE